MMEKVVTIAKSFAESDARDKAYYQSLTPHERRAILCELNSRWPRDENAPNPDRLERVYRIVKFPCSTDIQE